MPITEQLVRFILTPATQLASRDLRARAVRSILDTVAVTIAGAPEPGVRALEQALEHSGDTRTSPIPWSANRYRPEDACLLLGMASHILDYDDVSMLAVCHPSAPVLSGLWALAPHTPASGSDFIDAYLVGTEVLIRSGQAMGFRHYELGFHATATLGTLGAAAACGRLLKLDPSQTAHALAIAASRSSGVRKNFGSMVKSLHVGMAAAGGLGAARLAQAGVQGAQEVLEEGGWLRAFSGGLTDTWPAGLVLGSPFAIHSPGFEQKRYPCCYLMHKIIEATLALRREHGLLLNGLEHARVDMCKGGTAPLIHPLPRNGLNGKFSGPYAVVAALADGQVNLQTFEDKSVLRSAVQVALATVQVVESDVGLAPGSDVGSAPVTVTLTYRDGRCFSRTVTLSSGSPEDPLTDADLLEKWRDCLLRGLPRLASGAADALFDAGAGLDAHANAAEWLQLFRFAT
jgi:2-methylcitrate dehydratase PrpD